MKRVIRVWRILAVSLVGLVFLAAVLVTIFDGPHHAFLKEIYSFLGILGSDPPPKFILFFVLILFAEIPFLVHAGDDGNELPALAEKGRDEVPEEKKMQIEQKRKRPFFPREPAGKEAAEKAPDRGAKPARERAEKTARKERTTPERSGFAQAAAEVQPAPETSMEIGDFDQFLSDLRAELFENENL